MGMRESHVIGRKRKILRILRRFFGRSLKRTYESVRSMEKILYRDPCKTISLERPLEGLPSKTALWRVFSTMTPLSTLPEKTFKVFILKKKFFW